MGNRNTGKTTTPSKHKMHAFIRNEIAKNIHPKIANKTTILWRKCKCKNAAALFICNDIDGSLVGEHL